MVSEKIIVQTTFSVVLILSSAQCASAMYDPMLGRFASRDPIAFADGNSQYASYFANTSLCDPNGTLTRLPNSTDPGGPDFSGCMFNCPFLWQPRTDTECCRDAMKEKLNFVEDFNGRRIPTVANVVCCDGRKVICLYQKNPGRAKTKEGEEIIRKCIVGEIGHETAHLHHGDCPKCGLTNLTINNPKYTRSEGECEAYTWERICLEDSRNACSTQECRDDVDRVLADVKKQQAIFCSRAFGRQWESQVPWIFWEPPFTER